jgi:hypothetical protein
LIYVDQTLLDDESFIEKIIKLNGLAILFASERLKNDRKLILKAVKKNDQVFK